MEKTRLEDEFLMIFIFIMSQDKVEIHSTDFPCYETIRSNSKRLSCQVVGPSWFNGMTPHEAQVGVLNPSVQPGYSLPGQLEAIGHLLLVFLQHVLNVKVKVRLVRIHCDKAKATVLEVHFSKFWLFQRTLRGPPPNLGKSSHFTQQIFFCNRPNQRGCLIIKKSSSVPSPKKGHPGFCSAFFGG